MTKYDVSQLPLPDWFEKAFQERPGIGTIGVTSTTPNASPQEELFAQIQKGGVRLKPVTQKPKPGQVQTPGANGRLASDARRGSLVGRRDLTAPAGTSASSFSLGMPTGTLAGSSGRTGTHAALAERLHTRLLVEDTHMREATRRLQPQRATLLDAMEVAVRARARALDGLAVAAVAASA